MASNTPERLASPLRLHAADALRRARKLPIGPDRNDLRQLALGLLWMEKQGLNPLVLNGDGAFTRFAVETA